MLGSPKRRNDDPGTRTGNGRLGASAGFQKLPPVDVRNLRLSDASLAKAFLVTADLTA
jgi:hypothetical protein